MKRFYRKKVAQSLIESFNNALNGLLEIFYQERNMRIHLIMALVILSLALILRIDVNSFLWLSSAIALVFIAETFNTVVESLVDMITMRDIPQAKIVKDMAAGGVLIAVVYSIVVGYVIFFPRLEEMMNRVSSSSITSPEYIAILIAVLTTFTVVYMKVKLSRHEEWEPLRGGAVSGHAALAFAIATYLSLLSKDLKVAIATLVLATLVAHSRIEGKIHTTSEVILGALIGVATALLGLLMIR